MFEFAAKAIRLRVQKEIRAENITSTFSGHFTQTVYFQGSHSRFNERTHAYSNVIIQTKKAAEQQMLFSGLIVTLVMFTLRPCRGRCFHPLGVILVENRLHTQQRHDRCKTTCYGTDDSSDSSRCELPNSHCFSC